MSINLNKFKLKIDSTTLISWGDNNINDWHFSEISYEARLLQPDEFRFKIHRDAFIKSYDDFTFEKATTWLGKEIECDVEGEGDNNKLAFKGFVVEVQASARYVMGVARSKECVLDDTRRCCSYLDNSLSNIIKDTLKDTKIENLTNKVDGELFTKKINYIVRYNETSYEFLTRLARQYGFSIYWNHTYDALMIDKLKGDSTFTMKNVSEYSGYTYTMKTRCASLHYAGYDYFSDRCVSRHGAAVDNNAVGDDNMNFAKAKEASDRLFPDVPEARRQYYDYSIDGMGLTDDLLHVGEKGIRSQYIECTGKTNLFLSIGDVIELEDTFVSLPPVSVLTKGKHNPMIVTGVKYCFTDDGLEGSFTAISAESEVPPYFDENAYPKSGPQRAVVVDNNDPDKLGRVRVQFLWQKLMDDNNGKQKETITPWIRIAQPYAGMSRGFYVIPEIRDEVIVGFEQDNVERPFVIGSLYHNLAEKTPELYPDWVTEEKIKGNVVKGFKTRNGHTIEVLDAKDDNNKIHGKIHVYHKFDDYDISLSSDEEKKEIYVWSKADADKREKKLKKCKEDLEKLEKDLAAKEEQWKKDKEKLEKDIKDKPDNEQKDAREKWDKDNKKEREDFEKKKSDLEQEYKKVDEEKGKVDLDKLKIEISSDGAILINSANNLILKGKNVIIAADESINMTTEKFTANDQKVEINTGIFIKKEEKDCASEIFVKAGAADKADAISKIEVRGGKEEKDINIKVNVPSKIETTLAAGYTLKAKEITEKATDGDYTLTASAITEKATDGNYALTASAITEKATDGEFSLEAKKITEKANGNYAVEAMSISEKANNDCKIEGTTLTVEGKTTADFKGGATTNVKGGIVNIN